MFKKFMATILICCTFNAYGAVEGSPFKSMQDAFDSFNFAIEIEWNGVDQSFLTEQTEKLTSTLKNLQAAGFTKEELMQGVLTKIKNKRLAAELISLYEVVQIDKLTNEGVYQFLKDHMASTYSSGANFTGAKGTRNTLLVALIASVIIVALVKPNGGSSKEDQNNDNCGDDDQDYCGDFESIN